MLLTGTAGTGKTLVAANFAQAAGHRGERVLFFSFEESPDQLIRNVQSIGVRLAPLAKTGLLRIRSVRPALFGLEMHLATMFHDISTFKPHVVVVDPVTSLIDSGTGQECKGMVTRLIDYLKAEQITSLFTSLTQGGQMLQQGETSLCSLMDSWLLLQDIEGNGERNRVLYVLKSRGMAHSNQVREFLISDRGIDLVDAYIGPSGVMTGSARAAQGALEKAAALAGRQELSRRKRELVRKHAGLERRISELRSEHEAEASESRRVAEQGAMRTVALAADRAASGILRQADSRSDGLRLSPVRPSCQRQTFR